MLIFLIFTFGILVHKKKIFTFLGITYFFSCLYVYSGLIILNQPQLDNNELLYGNLKLLFILHFLIVLFFSKEEKVHFKFPNYFNNLFLISSFFVFYYFTISLLYYNSSNLEISRLELFFNNKLLYYNLLFIWPFLFLTKKNQSFLFILIYLGTCYLTGFRSLLVNFIFLYIIKQKLVYQKKVFNLKLIIIVFTIFSGVLLISFYRSGDVNYLFSLFHRVFIINAENIYYIVELNHPIYLTQFFRDFVPIRYLFSPFLNLDLTTAESITKEINYYYFQTGRIMTPTSLGLIISALGVKFIYLYPVILLIINFLIKKFIKSSYLKVYLVFISISMVTRGIWTVLGLYFVPILCIIQLIRFYKKVSNKSYVKYSNSLL